MVAHLAMFPPQQQVQAGNAGLCIRSQLVPANHITPYSGHARTGIQCEEQPAAANPTTNPGNMLQIC